MSKMKSKILTFAITLTIAMIIGFYFSSLIDLVLSKTFENMGQLKLNIILKSLSENKRHKLLLLCTELVFLAFSTVIVFTSKKETFESDTLIVTESIKTPISIGQGQHGTSKWLDKIGQRKVFKVFALSTDDINIQKLIDSGEKDRKEVVLYQNKRQTERDKSRDNKNKTETQSDGENQQHIFDNGTQLQTERVENEKDTEIQ